MRPGLVLSLLVVACASACAGGSAPPPRPGAAPGSVPVEFDFDESPALGPPDAPVTVVEFGDFFCHYCRKQVPAVYQLHEAYPDRVRIVFKHTPLVTPYSRVAALLAIAAQRQGRFWEMHDLLFERGQSVVTERGLEAAARELGLDLEQLHADAASGSAAERVEDDTREAREAGVRGTPSFFVNGRPLLGFQSYGRLALAVEQELALLAPEPL